MKVNNCLILSAGFGTRMGEQGKELPKVLWPIFNMPLLGLQIEFAKSLGSEKVFVNTHFLSEQISNYLNENYPEVVQLHESELLGSGGAIHNLARSLDRPYDGSLLIINGDQFYFNEDSFLQKLLSDKDDFNVRLVSITVDSNYNGLILEDKFLKEIRPPEMFSEKYLTYSGMAYINLNNLNQVEGNSSFFETVADFKNKDIEVLNPNEQEYWDFGTLELYLKNLKKLSESNSKSKFYNFCKSLNIDFENKTNILINNKEFKL